jgi:hypothetical protein
MPSAAATVSCAACGFWTGAHAVTLPSEIRHRHRRLHRRVRVMGDVVRGLDDLAALCEFGVDVAAAPCDLARLLHGCEQFLPIRRRVVRRVRAEVPLELQLFTALERCPRAVRDHGHAAERLESDWRLPTVESDDLPNARHGERRLVVHRLQLRAEDRRMLDGGVHHAVDLGIHPVDRLAAHDAGEIVERAILADIAPCCPRLELQRLRLWRRQLGRCRHERAVRRPAVRRLVHDLVQAGLALGRRHVPLRRRGLHQHRARRRAGLPERVEEVANGFRAVGVLVAVARVADALRDFHARPIGVELVGGHHRQRRSNAGPHLRSVRHDVDGAVGIDPEINGRTKGRRVDGRLERHRLREQ